jgi:hypothetical protein
MTADGTQTMWEQVKNDPHEPAFAHMLRMALAPAWLKYIILLISKTLGWKRVVGVAQMTGMKSAYEVWKLQHKRKVYTDKFLESMKSAGIDAIIAPGNNRKIMQIPLTFL